MKENTVDILPKRTHSENRLVHFEQYVENIYFLKQVLRMKRIGRKMSSVESILQNVISLIT